MNITRLPLIAATMLTVLVGACSQPLDILLTPQFGTSGNDSGNEISAGSGSVYMLGTWGDKEKLFRFGSAGNLPWFQGFAPKPGDDTIGFGGLVQTVSGNVVALYSSSHDDYGDENSGGGDVPITTTRLLLKKVAPTGKAVWERTLLTTTEIVFQNDFQLEQDKAGNLYVAVGGDVGQLRKYDAKGSLLWQKAVPGILWKLAVSPGGLVFTSEVVSDGKNASTSLVRYSPSGARLGATNVPFVVLELSASRDSEVYVSGSSKGSYPVSVNHLAKYSAQGKNLWLKTFRQAEYGWRAEDVAADPQGNVVVSLSDGYDRGILEKYTASGTKLWSKTLDQPVQDVSVFGPSAIYVSGATTRKVHGVNRGLEDGYLLRLDGSGKQVWIR